MIDINFKDRKLVKTGEKLSGTKLTYMEGADVGVLIQVKYQGGGNNITKRVKDIYAFYATVKFEMDNLTGDRRPIGVFMLKSVFEILGEESILIDRCTKGELKINLITIWEKM